MSNEIADPSRANKNSLGRAEPRLTATLDVEVFIRISVSENRGLDILDIRCARMPWLGEEDDVKEDLNSAVKSTSENQRRNKKLKITSFRDKFASRLKILLEREEIDVEPDIRLILEEEAQDAFRKIHKPSADWVTFVEYDDIVRRESINVTRDDIDFHDDRPSLVFHPNIEKRRLNFSATLTTPVWLRKVELLVGNDCLAERTYEKRFDRGEHTIVLPSPPVTSYSQIKNNTDCSLRFTVGENTRVVFDTINCEVPKFTREPRAIFMDMGSTSSKLITIDAGNWRQYSPSELKERIEELNANVVSDSMLSKFQATTPEATHKFLERYGLPKEEKRSLAEMSDEELAGWLGGAINRFAVYYADRASPIAVSDVLWSFPRTDGKKKRDFGRIAKKVMEIASTSILGKVEIIEEHEALRHRFQNTLLQLAELSRKSIAEKNKINKRNSEKRRKKKAAEEQHDAKLEKREKIFWLWRGLSPKPDEPDWNYYKEETVPTIQEFCEQFKKMARSPELKDWLVLDAGGFTLDVYGCIAGKELGQSYRAGGEDLTEDVCKFLADVKEVDKVQKSEAEALKIDACAVRSLARPLAKFCREKTCERYGSFVREVISWANKAVGRGATIGLPLILTGGAMSNDHLRQLIETEATKHKGFEPVVITSVQISQIITKELSQQVQTNDLQRFLLATHGFNTMLNRDIRRDVAAGLIEYFVGETN